MADHFQRKVKGRYFGKVAVKGEREMKKSVLRKIVLFVAVVFMLTLCTACGSMTSVDRSEQISSVLGVDVSAAIAVTTIDSHGGFHGDGTSRVLFQFDDKGCEEQIKNNALWKPLPLTENLTALVYGIRTETTAIGPYIDIDGAPAIPKIDNGYYFFLDRNYKSTDPYDDTDVLIRASFNLTIAIYDSDTDILYYSEFDT